MLQHVALEVAPDTVEDCVAFWALLGFERAGKPPRLQTSSTWVAREGTQIHLMPFEDPNTTVNGHAAVVVEDYEATLAALRERAFELRDGSNAWGAPRTFTRDPAGNLVELMSAPPPRSR